MFVAGGGHGSSSTNCFDKSRRQYVVKALGFSVTGARTTSVNDVRKQEGRKEGIRGGLARRREERGRERESKREDGREKDSLEV